MVDDKITVLIATSPIKSHPSLEIIAKCINSVRVHLPNSHIHIMADGVRPEQNEYRDRYQKYLERLAEIVSDPDDSVFMTEWDEHRHQAAMTAYELKEVQTPLILFMEHDTFFIDDAPIDWEGIARVILSGELNVVEFHCQWEPWILPCHEHLMLDTERHFIDGVPFVRTWMWSQRPHVAHTMFYKAILASLFTDSSRTFIEDRLVPMLEKERTTMNDWRMWKLAYYAPEGSIRRTWTDDGRSGDPKYEVTF
jgi:hypothetical protein